MIRAFFYKSKALFSILRKGQGKSPLSNPRSPFPRASCAPATSLYQQRKYLVHERNY